MMLPRLVFTALTVSSLALAQIPQGSVVGRVTDPANAVIASAKVTLENQATGVKRTANTNVEGLYAFNYLESGVFRISIKAAGFNLGIYPDIGVQAGEKVRVDAHLRVGDVSTSVEVAGASALVQTEAATVGMTITQREVTELPVRDREFSQLALLVPGISPAGTTGGALITQFATAVQAGGTSSNKNAYTIDGVDNTFNVWNGPAMNPSIDAIQEFRIERALFSAEFGRGGAELHLITKSGTNQYHGVLWEYIRNFNLNAGNWLSGQRDPLKRNQFGANLGWPIKKNKLFFFFNWESQRERSASQQVGTVLTDAMRQGDLSSFPRQTLDPQNGQPFPNNMIPRNRLNPVSLAYLEAMSPHPNRPGVVNNYLRVATTTRDWDQYISRVDWQPDTSNLFFFRFNAQPRNGISAPLVATSINHHEDFNFINSGVGWNRTWSVRTLTETRFGFQRQRLLLASLPASTLPSTAILGFGSVQPPAERLPVINITDTSGFHQWGFPLGFLQNSLEIVQNATFYRGNHILKAGFSGRRQMLHKDKGPEYMFNISFTGAYSGTGPGDYLLGLPFTASEALKFNVAKQFYGDYAGFVQDDWKVTPSLTLNLGLRYELNTLPSEERNLWGNFSPELQKIVLAGDHIVEEAISDPVFLNSYRNVLITAKQTNLPAKTLVFPDKNNFSPRFGFAWRPFKNNKTVVRGGYGIYYLLEDGNIAFNNTGTIPYGGSVNTLNTTPAPRFTIDAPFGAGIADLPKPSASYRDPHMRTSYLQQFTFSIQRELPWSMVFDINFQDQDSLKLESSWNLNVPAPAPGAVDPRRPFQLFGASIGGTYHDGHSRYDALEMSLRKQSRHYTFQWSHVWAKNMVRTAPLNPYDRDAFVGPSGYIPQFSKFHFVVDLPFGKGHPLLNQGGIVDYVLGGWAVSGFAIFQSGGPLTPTWNGDTANVGIATVRPNRIGDGSVSDPTMARWIDPAAFAAPTALTFGNSGTGILFGPSSQFFDAAVHKNFAFREWAKLQFRAEAFNVFNHPNFGSPNLAVNGLNFGQILLKTSNPRVYQMALRLNF